MAVIAVFIFGVFLFTTQHERLVFRRKVFRIDNKTKVFIYRGCFGACGLEFVKEDGERSLKVVCPEYEDWEKRRDFYVFDKKVFSQFLSEKKVYESNPDCKFQHYEWRHY